MFALNESDGEKLAFNVPDLTHSTEDTPDYRQAGYRPIGDIPKTMETISKFSICVIVFFEIAVISATLGVFEQPLSLLQNSCLSIRRTDI